MSTIFVLFMVLIMIACVLLIVIVMAQNPKGGGLSGTFGGASSAQFGVQRTNDFMEKATWTLGITVVVLVLLSIILTGKPSVQLNNAPAKKESATMPTQNAPAKSTTTLPTQQPAK